MSTSVLVWLFGGGKEADAYRGPRSDREPTSVTTSSARADTAREAESGDASLRALLARIQSGDRTAFDTLYHTLAESLWSVAILQTRSADIAEEIVQDVFFWLWRHRETVKPEIDVRIYLTTAVRNRARNLAQHRHTVEALESSVRASGVERLGWSPSAPSADADVEQRDFWEAYAEALAMLSEREREVAFLRWEEGLTLEQIGVVLSLSTSGARNVLLRAQAKIQGLLRAYL